MPSSADQPRPSEGETPLDDQSETTSAPVSDQQAPRRTPLGPFALAVAVLFVVAMAVLMIAALVLAL